MRHLVAESELSPCCAQPISRLVRPSRRGAATAFRDIVGLVGPGRAHPSGRPGGGPVLLGVAAPFGRLSADALDLLARAAGRKRRRRTPADTLALHPGPGPRPRRRAGPAPELRGGRPHRRSEATRGCASPPARARPAVTVAPRPSSTMPPGWRRNSVPVAPMPGSCSTCRAAARVARTQARRPWSWWPTMEPTTSSSTEPRPIPRSSHGLGFEEAAGVREGFGAHGAAIVTAYDYIRDGAAIYRKSFAIIRAEADLGRFGAGEERVAVRIIHACGMVEAAADIVFSPGAVAAAKAALARRCADPVRRPHGGRWRHPQAPAGRQRGDLHPERSRRAGPRPEARHDPHRGGRRTLARPPGRCRAWRSAMRRRPCSICWN